MRNYFLSFRALIYLQVLWLLVILFALIIVASVYFFSSTSGNHGAVSSVSGIGQVLIFFAGILAGFGASAFFSRPQQVLVRGSSHAVYLIENNFWLPHLHKLANPKTLGAFGGIWHEIQHVSESMLKQLICLFGKDDLDITKAELYEVGKSIYAVLNDTRYGVPDPDTSQEIWPGKSPSVISVPDLDKYRPGRDLVSIFYWHPRK